MSVKKNKLVSIIVPCYNEQEVLPLFYKEISKVFKQLKGNYELILINDGSKDDTLKVMKNIAKKDKHVAYYSFSRNFGKESAMYAGLINAKGDYVGFIDADLQHPPKYILQMVDVLNKSNYDCVACRRTDRKGDSKVRTWFSKKFYKIINKMSDAKMVDGAGDYRLMKKSMVEAVLSLNEYNRFSKGIFSWVGFNTYWIEYENVDRAAGSTSWSFTGLIKYAIDGIINFSQAPLDVVSICGFLTTALAFLYLIFILIKYSIFGDQVQGWATTICVILFLGGTQLLSLGIMGQYVGKTYLEIKNRPHFIVSESNNKKAEKIR